MNDLIEMDAMIAAFDEEPAEDAMEAKQNTYGCDYVARVIGTSAQTIRNYTKDYDEYLSYSRGENGQRLYSRRDGSVLKKIHELRTKEGKNKAEIKRFLSSSIKLSPQAKKETEIIASAVSTELQEKIKSFFDIGMQGISKQVNKLSTHMDSMEGAVMKQKEEMKRLQAQNDALREEVEENRKIVQLLAKDMEKTNAEQTDILKVTQKNVTDMTGGGMEDVFKKSLDEKLETFAYQQRDDHNELVRLIQDVLSTDAPKSNEAEELSEKYEKARTALTRLAAEIDAKNAQIAELVSKQKAPVKKNEVVTLDTETPQLKTLSPEKDYVKSLKKVATTTPKEVPQSFVRNAGSAIIGAIGARLKQA